MDRRSFLSWVGVGFLASSLPVAIAACSTEETASTPEVSDPPPPPPEALAREDGFVALGPTLALETDGSLKGEAGALKVVVAQSPSDPATYIAVGATCPHSGCTVDWKSDQKLFECPCHQSRFNPDGSVVNGPAAEDLPSFDVKIEEDVVLVKPA